MVGRRWPRKRARRSTLVFLTTDREQARARRDSNRNQRSRPDVINPVDHADGFEPPQPHEPAIHVRPGEHLRRWVRQHSELLSDPPAG